MEIDSGNKQVELSASLKNDAQRIVVDATEQRQNANNTKLKEGQNCKPKNHEIEENGLHHDEVEENSSTDARCAEEVKNSGCDVGGEGKECNKAMEKEAQSETGDKKLKEANKENETGVREEGETVEGRRDDEKTGEQEETEAEERPKLDEMVGKDVSNNSETCAETSSKEILKEKPHTSLEEDDDDGNAVELVATQKEGVKAADNVGETVEDGKSAEKSDKRTPANVEDTPKDHGTTKIGEKSGADSNTSTAGTDTEKGEEVAAGEAPISDNFEEGEKPPDEKEKPPDKKKGKENKETKDATNDAEEGVGKETGTTNDDGDIGCSENPVFVQVNAESEKEDADKSATNENDQEDPIASDCFVAIEEEEDSNTAEQGTDEDLCIIPDTERIISQEEKEAASAMIPIRNIAENIGDSEPEIIVNNNVDAEEKEAKYVISKYTDETVQECGQCSKTRKANYVAILDKKSVYICDENCLSNFKEGNANKFICNVTKDIRVKNLAHDTSFLSKADFLRKCSECGETLDSSSESLLSWETMDFCGELCLGKYQKSIGGSCSACKSEVRLNCLGKYCVRFGNDVRQFCSSSCLDDYKKKLKICSLCQKDMSQDGGGFLAPIDDKGQFKDFCTESCMEKYNEMTQTKVPEAKEGVKCSVCLHENPITIEYEHEKKNHLICSLPCLIAFKFVNKITPGKCDKCMKYFDIKVLEKHCIYFEESPRNFCSKVCRTLFINSNRRIVPCVWCKVKKYNFDMIRRTNGSGQVLMMCSLNCLSLYQVSINAVNSKKICCDHCLQNLKPLYHLTMSDATLRNFCSYDCVMAFQNQFSKTPITFNESDTPVPTGQPKRAKRLGRPPKAIAASTTSSFPSLPVISNVQSLATATNGTVTTRSTRSQSAPNATVNSAPPAGAAKAQIKQQLVVKPLPLPQQKNVATMCTVQQISKGVNAKPTVNSIECQTEEEKPKVTLIPVPVPIFVPVPVHMFTAPCPVPVPFPLPVPVPVFIPTTRNSANGIMKEIKKIQVKIPTDPFEAELLMMAEMVAGDKKEENHTDSESDEEDTTAAAAEETTFSPEPVDASNTFGDDMLQMALKMATELDEPAVDLEGALTASTITASQGGEAPGSEENVDDPQPIHHHIIENRASGRGRKRGMRQIKAPTTSKRGRRMANQVEIPIMAPPQPPPPPEPIEKPDANMCLKYTFGVNAWKQWVTTKNAELEKSSRRVKLFKPEILQLTADELNYSLCLFVKEVRKPNGSEYAPDTIYYLCLGIQQYLFENGRIDNIFCDAYYEKFTDCLDEVARKFSVLYNDSHYIVTRVEEEHLWESKQLGAHSPHVLLSTLMFFNTKHFNLTTVDEHMQLSFSHIMKHWKRNPNQPGTAKVPGSRNVLLRFYPPQSALDGNARKKKVYEQQENEENPLRCPVKLYEFYLSKCPESVKTRNDVFYLQPERSCVPDSPVWYSTMPLGREALEKMLHRVKMVKEINVALLTS